VEYRPRTLVMSELRYLQLFMRQLIKTLYKLLRHSHTMVEGWGFQLPSPLISPAKKMQCSGLHSRCMNRSQPHPCPPYTRGGSALQFQRGTRMRFMFHRPKPKKMGPITIYSNSSIYNCCRIERGSCCLEHRKV